MIDEISGEFNRLNSSDKRFLARSWDALKRWIGTIFNGVITNALWELIKAWWSTLGYF